VTSSFRQRKLALAGQRRKDRPRRGRRGPPPPQASEPLDAVAFGHPSGRDKAEAAGLTWRDFANSGLRPSGAKGYLVSDVEAIAERKRTEEA